MIRLSERHLTSSLTQYLRHSANIYLLTVALLVAWMSLSLVLYGYFTVPTVLERYHLYPLILGIVFLGLPHGALDHLVPGRLGYRWGRSAVGFSTFMLLYIGIAAGYFALWLWQPNIAFVGFLLATIWHWGQGDLRFIELFLGRQPSPRWGSLVSILFRGSLPIVMPIIAFPETAERLLREASHALGVVSTISLQDPLISNSLGLSLLILASLYLTNAMMTSPNSLVLLIDISEIYLLLLCFYFVPAYLAIGIYFIFWHSLRHLLRLLLLRQKDRQALAIGHWKKPVWQLIKDLIPITLIALVMLSVLGWWASSRILSLEGFVALYLVLISSLTKPHLLVVALMDSKQR